MFVQAATIKLILSCKDCLDQVNDLETNAYHLIRGVLYGWCDRCFANRPDLRKPPPD
jgi:hypothetical protein